MASIMGRMNDANRSLRAAITPIGIPTTTQKITALITMANVVMASSQNPRKPIKRKVTTPKMPTFQLAMRQAIRNMAAIITIGGTICSNPSMPLRVFSTGHLMAWNCGR